MTFERENCLKNVQICLRFKLEWVRLSTPDQGKRCPPDCSGSGFGPDQVLLSRNFHSRPGSRQKFLLRKSGVEGGGQILSLIDCNLELNGGGWCGSCLFLLTCCCGAVQEVERQELAAVPWMGENARFKNGHARVEPRVLKTLACRNGFWTSFKQW